MNSRRFADNKTPLVSRYVSWLNEFFRDLYFGWRSARKAPGFTLLAVLTLSLGIGLNTAIFSMFYAVVFRPMPWREPGRMVIAFASNSMLGLPKATPTSGEFVMWTRQARSFEAIAAAGYEVVNALDGDRPRRVAASVVSPDFLKVFGVSPLLGEMDPAEPDRVLISENFWRNNFGQDPRIVGRSLRINGQRVAIGGVLPGNFEVPLPGVEIWIPKPMQHFDENNWGTYMWGVFARLKDGVSQGTAQSEMDVLSQRAAQEHADKKDWTTHLMRMDEFVSELAGPPLLFLQIMVAAAMAICCVNVGNMLLARGLSRQREIAVRGALGAGRARIVRQLLAETLVFCGLGGIAGLFVASGLIAALGRTLANAQFPIIEGAQLNGLPRMWSLALDTHAFFFAMATTGLAALVCGLFPAWRSSQFDLASGLKGSGGSEASAGMRLGNFLVIVEVAVCLMLLVMASLMARAFLQARQADRGYQAKGLLTLDSIMSGEKYATPEKRSQFFIELFDRLGQLPSVTSVGVAAHLPYDGVTAHMSVNVEGDTPGDQTRTPAYRRAGPGYFETMRIPIQHGRSFTRLDNLQAQPVVIVTESMARQFFRDPNPVGRRISISDGGPNPAEIVGVVKDAQYSKIAGPREMAVYRPILQAAGGGTWSVVIATSGAPGLLAGSVRKTIWSMDPDLPIEHLLTMEDRLSAALSGPRIGAQILSIFAGGGLSLALIGIYALLAYSVTRRTREIGIRGALGAMRSDLIRMILAQGGRLLMIGIAVGLACCLMSAKLIERFLLGFSGADPGAYLIAVAAILTAGLAACLIPARKAASIQPLDALRSE